jgi:DNA-binding MarR family transcriptional regulator
MPATSELPPDAIREVRDHCLCLASQRAARRLARRFDRAFQPAGLTNGQFSALMFLAGAGGASPSRLADLLAMDRTTVTALLKALTRRGLVVVEAGEKDRRTRRAGVTPAGREALAKAMPVWRAEHAALEATLPGAAEGRAFLAALAQAPIPS